MKRMGKYYLIRKENNICKKIVRVHLNYDNLSRMSRCITGTAR
jgi:hypothetical protein